MVELHSKQKCVKCKMFFWKKHDSCRFNKVEEKIEEPIKNVVRRRRRTKTAIYKGWSDVPKTDNSVNSYSARRWKYNPNCKFHNIVKAIEREKRANGEEE